MNWLNKLEQKYGSKAIPNITRIFIAANLIGSVLLLTKGDVVLYYLQFSASAILHRQNINKSCKNDMLPLGTKIQLIRRHTCPCKIAEAENCR